IEPHVGASMNMLASELARGTVDHEAGWLQQIAWASYFPSHACRPSTGNLGQLTGRDGLAAPLADRALIRPRELNPGPQRPNLNLVNQLRRACLHPWPIPWPVKRP